MSDAVIKIENIGKMYRLGETVDLTRTFREMMLQLPRLAGRKARKGLRRLAGARGEDQILWALREVNLEIKEGEVLGIIGRNGAGKSTLLKILSRITKPTMGRIEMRGRVGSLLEVGTGFHPELTGRENIFLNGAILGMRRVEIQAKFDEIVEFSGVERFLDTPVKRYSTGMRVRLGFSVAAHLEPEILIVDEVLSVGDAEFRRKCLGKMQDVAGGGRTVIFVSHNMAAVSRLCNLCVFLDQGTVRGIGEPEKMIAEYLYADSKQDGAIHWPEGLKNDGVSEMCVRGLKVRNPGAEPSGSLNAGKPILVDIAYEVFQPLRGLRVGMQLINGEGVPIMTSFDVDDPGISREKPAGVYEATCEIPAALLNEGTHGINLIAGVPGVKNYVQANNQIQLTTSYTTMLGEHAQEARHGVIRPQLSWTERATNGLASADAGR